MRGVRGRRVTWWFTAVVSLTVLVLALRPGDDSTLQSQIGSDAAAGERDGTQVQALPFAEATRRLVGPTTGSDGRVLPPAGRMALAPTLPQENRHSLGPATTSPRYVSGIVMDQQVLFGDAALPWRYHLDPAVPGSVDQLAVHQAVAEWDDSPGSRWSSEFVGIQAGTNVADGRSTIFMEAACEGLTTANSYLYTDGGLGINRYGTQATQILEADIGLCPPLADGGADEVALAVRHEVGHVIGLAHLCDPGDDCWVEGMGRGPSGCRVMFWQARPCQTSLTEDDRFALATLYPTLKPLSAPSEVLTAARVSFAMFADLAAEGGVVIQADTAASVAPAAAALASAIDGPLLVADPSPDVCLGGAAAVEINRTLQRRAPMFLVGDFAGPCHQQAYDWQVTLRRVATTDPLTMNIALAQMVLDVRPLDADAIVVIAAALDGRSIPADAVAGTALAVSAGSPVIVLPPDGTRVLADWIVERGITDVTVVGGGLSDDAVTAFRTTGAVVNQVDGGDPVSTSVRVADLVRQGGGTGVVLAPANPGPAGLASIVVSALDRAAVVITPPAVDPVIQTWLSRTGPTHGWAVGTVAELPPEVLAAYAAAIN